MLEPRDRQNDIYIERERDLTVKPCWKKRHTIPVYSTRRDCVHPPVSPGFKRLSSM